MMTKIPYNVFTLIVDFVTTYSAYGSHGGTGWFYTLTVFRDVIVLNAHYGLRTVTQFAIHLLQTEKANNVFFS